MVFVLLCNMWVVMTTRSQSYFSVKKLPTNEVGLVLGTSKATSDGKENLFFKYRMEAAARLFNEGKVKYLILSGNNDSKYYNEPLDMQKAIMALGVPRSAMQLDYAGYRTFDSVIRCKGIFNEDNITIVSQDFQNARALYIAKNEGINAVAFAAQDVPAGYSVRTLVREYLARPKAVLDVHFYRPPTLPHNKMR
ncbi:SanA protein [Cytophagaceae bacterium SJW1-29]|uniref:SanA protein n=1 Tax=Salmonirosea aquatica TaxID=2654236 RepID=A0A7C9FQC4_9BACT|nr:SanA protein [Cytophagaceae bacterium SJW1-29]